MNLERRPHESELDFHRRIVRGKLVDKTLSDVDYVELSNVLYGHPYSSDVARRMMYGSKHTLDVVDESRISDIKSDKVLSEIEIEKIELQKERQRLRDQRREYNKLINMTGRGEHLEEELLKAANNVSNTIGRMDYDCCDDSNISSDTEAVLVFCDWHYGMTADNVWNVYNTDVCKRRVTDVVSEAAKRIKLHGCHRLHILVLGDLIHGAIHTSARVASEELVVDQIMDVAEILAQAIEWLSNFVSQTDVYITYGNHARVIPNKQDNIHRDNMERIIPWWLNQRLGYDDKIDVHPESENEFVFFNVCGYGICASHGDLDTVHSSPRLLTTLYQKRYGKNVDYILLADKHHRESCEELGVSAMICGALCGTDEYANGKRLYSMPEQVLLIVNRDVGVDAEYHIKCN